MSKNGKIIRGLDSVGPAVRSCVLTIGNFDGVHLGHQRILKRAKELADAAGVGVAAMTFEPPPEFVLRPQEPPRRLTSPDEKARLLVEAGADWVVFEKADSMLLAMAPTEFIDSIIMKHFSPRHIVEGPNFFFGLARSGNVRTLGDAGLARNYAVHVIEPASVDLPDGPQRISSTLIRQLVMDGKVDLAAKCLGRPFTLVGKVVAGAGQGRILEFPTANLAPGEQVLPADGVYAGTAEFECGTFPTAISVGTKPTLGPAPRTIEAFLLDASGNFYDQQMTLKFNQFLRPQQRFDGMETLRNQIAKDVQRVREICR